METELQIVDVSAEAIITKAIEHNVAVETMERLLAMRTQLKQERAQEAFFNALADFQAECPTIKREKEVKDKGGKVRYRYAPLDKIVEQVKDLLLKHGFSYTVTARYEKGQDDGAQVATCTIHHKAGHMEISEFRAPIDPEAYMNDTQKNASALSYAKRYAFCNAFGILTADDDVGGEYKELNPDIIMKEKDHWKQRIYEVMNHPDFPKHVREAGEAEMLIDHTASQYKKMFSNAHLVLAKYQKAKQEALEPKQEPKTEEVLGEGDLLEGA